MSVRAAVTAAGLALALASAFSITAFAPEAQVDVSATPQAPEHPPVTTAGMQQPGFAPEQQASAVIRETHATPSIGPVRGLPTVRRIVTEAGVTGSEPDPELFDRTGLETWWQ